MPRSYQVTPKGSSGGGGRQELSQSDQPVDSWIESQPGHQPEDYYDDSDVGFRRLVVGTPYRLTKTDPHSKLRRRPRRRRSVSCPLVWSGSFIATRNLTPGSASSQCSCSRSGSLEIRLRLLVPGTIPGDDELVVLAVTET